MKRIGILLAKTSSLIVLVSGSWNNFYREIFYSLQSSYKLLAFARALLEWQSKKNASDYVVVALLDAVVKACFPISTLPYSRHEDYEGTVYQSVVSRELRWKQIICVSFLYSVLFPFYPHSFIR